MTLFPVRFSVMWYEDENEEEALARVSLLRGIPEQRIRDSGVSIEAVKAAKQRIAQEIEIG